MIRIQTMNRIAPAGLARFPAWVRWDSDVESPDALLVRSADLHRQALPPSVLAIARAGAGVNNIPVAQCTEQGIVVFNTPGANANAVKELVIAGLLLASRRIVAAAAWVDTLKECGDDLARLVEQGKGRFAGPELAGKRLGVIGLGAIGVQVANAAHGLGMEVLGYDPYLSVEGAWRLSRGIRPARSAEELYGACDYITLHVPAGEATRGMICARSLTTMKDGVRILNFARGDLVHTADLLDALDSGKAAAYVTDFPAAALLGHPRVVALPHLGASTPEAEENCARMAADELMDYLEQGNIRHSVNFPAVSMPRSGSLRLCALHRNVPGMIETISGYCAAHGLNIEHMQSASRAEYAYTLVDCTGEGPADFSGLAHAPQMIRVRALGR